MTAAQIELLLMLADVLAILCDNEGRDVDAEELRAAAGTVAEENRQ